ncbi:hypothetical protein PH5382_00196 [Phaeobacter sp. CECT 5382]|nr:hypothetical protein PH5382_00196 [Phaeobacter sp. CECT 5382]
MRALAPVRKSAQSLERLCEKPHKATADITAIGIAPRIYTKRLFERLLAPVVLLSARNSQRL